MPSSNLSGRVIVLCLLGLAARSAADDATCPARHADKPLAIGYVLDGPSEEESVIMPDASGQKDGMEFATWLVDRIYDKGRRVTLECHYDGVDGPFFVPVTKPVTLCSYGKTKDRAVTLGCE